MATNLVRAGVDLTVNDLLPEAVEKLKKQGAAAADDAYIAQNCDIIFTIVPMAKFHANLSLVQRDYSHILKRARWW